MSRARKLFAASLIAFGLIAGFLPGSTTSTADAAGCVRFVGGNFDAAGNDHYNLNGEYVRFKNVCSTSKLLTGWKIHDYGRKHTYSIPTGFRIEAYTTVTLYSGSGTRTSTKLFWRRPYGSGAVWNNTPPERAYLRSAAGTLVSSWSEY